MVIWTVDFQVVRPLPAFAKPLRIEMEVQTDTSYYAEGKWRLGDRHCIFVYTLSGKGVFRDESGEHIIPPGTGFLCEVGNPSIAYYYPSGESEPWQFVWLGFIGVSATAMVRDLIARHGPIYTLPKGGGLIERFMAYKNYNGLSYELTPFDGVAIVSEVLTTLGNSAHSQVTYKLQNKLVRQTQDMVKDSLQKKINVADIARRLRISREHLSRVFKEHTGIPLHKYILQQKMLLACRLLKETQLTTKEISFRLGYDKPTNFSRAFSGLIRMRPSRYKVAGTMPFV